jgi:hypothetical protein
MGQSHARGVWRFYRIFAATAKTAVETWPSGLAKELRSDLEFMMRTAR